MRKWIKIGLSVAVVLLMAQVSALVAAAENKVTAIDIRVQLHEDGSATVYENRQMELEEGTEVYIVLENLNDTKLLDFEVAGFTEEADWDIDASFAEKANKYGVIETDGGYELAWGITEYGTQAYDVTYKLSNLVRELDDGQALFWNFDTFLDLPTDRMRIEISAPFDIGEEVHQFYAFGFEGPYDIVDGVFEWTGYGLDNSNDITVLLQFPPGVFATEASVDSTLVEQREMALAGSSYNEEEPMPTFLKVILGLLGVVGVGSVAGASAYGIRRSKVRKEQGHFNATQLMTKNDGRVSRMTPRLEADIPKYSFLIKDISITGGGFSEYFMAYLLVWSAQNRIQVEVTEEERRFFGPNTEARIIISNFSSEMAMNSLSFEEYIELFRLGESTLEEVIWIMLLEAADAQGEIEGKDLRDWSTENAEVVATLDNYMEEVSKEWLEANGYLNLFSVRDWGFPVKIEQLTEKGEQTALEIIRFDGFIEKIDEVEIAEYANWEDLIIWAAILGHAEDTIDYLEEFEPSTWAYLEESYPIYGHYYGYHYLYLSSSSGLSSGGYSSSGGGFSSGGGGMGAGGGGGGGTR